MNVRLFVRAVLAVAVVFLLSACGYYNPYAAGKSGKPILLYRTMWTNRTTEQGLENIIFQAQSDWLRKSRLITLCDSADGADYLLSGAVDRIDYPEVSFGEFQVASEGRIELAVTYTITEKTTGKVLLQRSATRTQTFTMNQNPLMLQSNRRVALEKIADLFGEEIYLFMTNTILRPGTPAAIEEVNEKIIQH